MADRPHTDRPDVTNLKGTAVTVVNPIDLDALNLARGAHSSIDEGACVMEAVAFVAGEPWSDHPSCASPVIAAFMRAWNDSLDDDDRNRLLKPYVVKLVGTASTPQVEDARAWMCLDWLVRVYTPAWLRLAGLTEHADRLAGLPEFKAGMDVPSIRPTIDAARKDAAAAWAAARVAARVAAGDAAGVAAGDAAWAAAGDVAWAAAWDAAWDAAGDAAGDAAWDAAGDAARVAAWDAARVAAWDAAWDAARARLQPVVDEMQPLALNLIDRMIAAQ